jgi:prolyl oligopeptidase
MLLRSALFTVSAALLLTPALTASALAAAPIQPLSTAFEKNVEEVYFGKKVSDPYRALENMGDPLVREWFREQSASARSILESIPGRKALIAKMQDFDSRRASKVYSLAITDNDRYFYLKETPKDETGRLFYRDRFEGRESFLFDARKFFAETGLEYVISGISASDDGSKVAIAVSANGTEDNLLLIMDVAAKKLYPEKIDRCRFASPSWLPDNSGFLYNRLQPITAAGQNPQNNSRTLLHRIGTDPSSDREIFSRAFNPELNIQSEDIPSVEYERKSGYLYANVSNVDRRLTTYYAPVSELSNGKIQWRKLFQPSDEIHDFAVTANDLYIYTPKNAPRFKVLKTSLRNPDFEHAEVVVAEDSSSMLTSFALTSDALYYTQSHNGVEARLFRKGYDAAGPAELKLPFKAGRIHLSSKGFRFPDLWVIIAGWSNDNIRFRVQNAGKEFRKETLSSPAEYPEYRDLVVEELMVPSHDGVRVPLSVIYRKGLKKNGQTPAFIYGYGAYGQSVTPFFNPGMLLWTDRGGVLAFAHVRGGGELGDKWHTDGMKTTKPNSWKDLISCAEYLKAEGYTGAGRIAINGASAGGILVGKAMTDRPDLFAAVIAQVGAMNPLRGEVTPNGPVNVPEFGTVKNREECMALIEMDPYLSIKKGVAYPAALVTTGLNDPRVTAWQPGKFAIRLQQATVSGKPVLFFADDKAGHGMGNSKTKEFEALADVLSFGLWQTGHPEFQIK